jgi:hypothetical protein
MPRPKKAAETQIECRTIRGRDSQDEGAENQTSPQPDITHFYRNSGRNSEKQQEKRDPMTPSQRAIDGVYLQIRDGGGPIANVLQFWGLSCILAWMS